MSSRERTERQILEALEAQIRDSGMKGVGINAVAKRAGVSKALIYRYFDGMPGLLLAWMREQDFWTSRGDLLGGEEPGGRTPAALILAMLRGQLEALAQSETLREVRRWELVERNEISAPLAERREHAARSFIDRIDGLTTEGDVPAMVGIMLAGVLYLQLRAKTESHFLGVPLHGEEGWARFDAALAQLIAALPSPLLASSLAELEARKAQPGGEERS